MINFGDDLRLKTAEANGLQNAFIDEVRSFCIKAAEQGKGYCNINFYALRKDNRHLYDLKMFWLANYCKNQDIEFQMDSEEYVHRLLWMRKDD